jgi:hypothetical protein
MLGGLKRNALALTALFVALGGSAYAVGRITGADVSNNSLTGKDVDEARLKVTRVVARPGSGDDVVGPVPAGQEPPPEPPSNFGMVYPVTPDAFTLKRRALVEVIGHVSAELQPPCNSGFAAAWVFIDGEEIARGSVEVEENVPLPGARPHDLFHFAPLKLNKGTHEVEVRISSVCEDPPPPPIGSPGVAARILEVRLAVVANQY